MAFIFHIVTKPDWKQAQKNGRYEPDSLREDGFIHFSRIDQLLQVANSFYKNQRNLLILKIDESKLNSELKLEPPLEAPLSEVLFPHLYGILNIDAVTAEFLFNPLDNGQFELPEDL